MCQGALVLGSVDEKRTPLRPLPPATTPAKAKGAACNMRLRFNWLSTVMFRRVRGRAQHVQGDSPGAREQPGHQRPHWRAQPTSNTPTPPAAPA